MMRQASGRNQRSKLFIVKNVLQVCILLVVCLWLLYQTKLSYVKNKALRENSSRISNNVARKDLTNDEVPASAGDKTLSSDSGRNDEDEEEEEDQEVRRAMEDAEVTADDGFDERHHEREVEDEQETISEEDQVEDAGSIAEDHEDAEGSSQERHEKVYMGDDASSAVLQVNQRTGADDKNSSVQERDMQRNDAIDKRDDDSKDSKHDSVMAIRNEYNQSSSPILTDNKPKHQVSSSVANKSYGSVEMQTDSLVVVPSNETAGSETSSVNSVEDPNSLKEYGGGTTRQA